MRDIGKGRGWVQWVRREIQFVVVVAFESGSMGTDSCTHGGGGCACVCVCWGGGLCLCVCVCVCVCMTLLNNKTVFFL